MKTIRNNYCKKIIIIAIISLICFRLWGNFYYVIIGIGIIVMVLLLNKKGINIAIENIKPFWDKRNVSKTSVLLIFIVVPFFILYAIIFKFPNFGKYSSNLNFLLTIGGLILTILGIFISAKVLMIVVKEKTITISDWLNMNIDIIKEANAGDNVYMISPTFCAGISKDKELLDYLYDVIEKKIDQGCSFNFAFLKAEDNVIDIDNDINKLPKNVNLQKLLETMYSDPHWIMYRIFLKDEYKKIDQTHHIKLINFINEHRKKVVYYYDKITKFNNTKIDWLNESYLTGLKKENLSSIFSGLFVTMNLTNGKYYMGSFGNQGVTTTFEGTMFENKHIKSSMHSFITNFINKNKDIYLSYKYEYIDHNEDVSD